MIKSQIKEIIDHCFTEGVELGYWSKTVAGRYSIEVPKRPGQGDFSTNFAMVAAGIDKRKPRDLALPMTELLARHPMVERVEIAGPGFINLFLHKAVWATVLAPIFEQGENFGRSESGRGSRVLVEFVSANPTGPLSIGHGRNAVLGDTIARLLDASGYEVQREYYFNDSGRQMRVLGESARARYLELLGLPSSFPEDGYQGDYIYEIARSMIEEGGDSFIDAPVDIFKERAQQAIFTDIDTTLKRIGIDFDTYFNEHSLYEDGRIYRVVDQLRAKGLIYEKEGATWFKASEFGQEQDRVFIKNTGEPTYRLPDIAYHCDKFERGYDWMINVFGSDHIATVPDVLAGVRALGYDDSRITVVLYQFVTLFREGRQVKMSTRKATFVTVDELVDEVGADALRFFFLMRKPDNLIEFDLDLAKKQSQENPVYYVQYAHARLCSIEKMAAEQGAAASLTQQDLQRLVEPEEYALLKMLAEYPQLVAGAAADLAPHRIIFYLIELAGQFHGFYNKHKVLTDDRTLTGARLALCRGVKTVVHNGLKLIGLTAPVSM
ncbi:MAG: arginine--tRNA ligase [Desulfobulbus sp.]|nr:arginine--tRNA ligase [Desulfobulbus sp.]